MLLSWVKKSKQTNNFSPFKFPHHFVFKMLFIHDPFLTVIVHSQIALKNISIQKIPKPAIIDHPGKYILIGMLPQARMSVINMLAQYPEYVNQFQPQTIASYRTREETIQTFRVFAFLYEYKSLCQIKYRELLLKRTILSCGL